ncbi:gamma-glutamylcyclotransferase [Kumtagia ephedrae]|uniref:glutathione-specific gamma-glutamylcyclotransferase n=1 Tax=Kumtagia ephedrae TaxID=2116701 RepID=A0A2P7SH32_9HYPH|nr:gamma-glutamylcyclotransferase [Mesorhizobium ephedrae]PSJ61799.1 gamma-glutamylcyclotransferase [Mesorhizobium ephedrae]
MKPRLMALTEEMVARCHRDIADSGQEPGLGYLDEDDYAQLLGATMEERPAGPLWLFAYGSLIWKPEIEHVEECVATARGYHRAFCIHQTRWRGTLEQPGLMMGLMPGGQCGGVAFRLPDGDPAEMVSRLIRREMTAKPSTYLPTWLKLDTAGGPLAALGFAVNPKGRTFAGKRSDAEVARILARACGHLGSGADYLFHTVRNLETRGIHDRRLWRLQELVAAELAADR